MTALLTPLATWLLFALLIGGAARIVIRAIAADFDRDVAIRIERIQAGGRP